MERIAASQMLDGMGVFSVLMRLRSMAPNPWLTVLTYHRVGSPSRDEGFDDHVIDARPDAFERQLEYIGRNANVISYEDLEAFKQGGALPNNPVLVTFDDGYLDNHDVALPLLKKHGVRATFFVSTSYVQERRIFWWDRVQYMMRRTQQEVLELTYPTRKLIKVGRSADERHAVGRSLLRPIKSHFGLDIDRYLEHLERATGVSIGRDEERAMADRLVMRWEHVHALERAGMRVESHTANHRVLSTLDEAALRDELRGSKRVLEDALGRRVTGVAYPVGKGLSAAPAARSAIREAGYEIGFSNGTGINHAFWMDWLDVRRLSLEIDVPDAFFRGMVALPYFAYQGNAPRR